MSTVRCVIDADPRSVFAVLADGWSYPLWVVGATHMRQVDQNWPEVGARLHHSVGAWPLSLEDRTEVIDILPGHRLELRAHAWPTGVARVVIQLQARGEGTLVTMTERAERGPGSFVPGPLQDLLLGPRNAESLQRLRAIAENRATEGLQHREKDAGEVTPSEPRNSPGDELGPGSNSDRTHTPTQDAAEGATGSGGDIASGGGGQPADPPTSST